MGVSQLSVHRNTRERRQRHEVSGSFWRYAKRCIRDKSIEGYAIVVWKADGEETIARVQYRAGGGVNSRVLPEYVRAHLQQVVQEGSVFIPDRPA